MSHGIMVCDVPLYRDITKVNIHAYPASKLVCVDSVEKLELLAGIDQTYEFIITLAVLDKKDITERVIKIKEKFLPSVPLVIIGHHNTVKTNVGNVLSAYDQLSIVKYIIKQLNWTATDLMNRRIDDFIPVPLSLIAHSPHAIEDLYINPKTQIDEYTLAAKKGDLLKEMIKSWKEMDIYCVYISSKKRLTAISEVTKFAIEGSNIAIESNDEQMEKDAVNQNMEVFSETFSDLNQFEKLSEGAREQVGVLVQKTTILIGKILNRKGTVLNPNLKELINTFNKEDQSYIPQLSFLSMYISIQMMRSESWFNEAVEEKVRYLHFFNNLALFPLYKKHPNFPKTKNISLHYHNLSMKEQELYDWHPKISSNLMSSIPGVPLGLDQLILQHHGTINGDCKSSNINDEISLLSKYCCVAELFAEHILDSEGPLNQKLKEEIIEKMKKQITLRSYLKLMSLLEEIRI